ncbi:MAG: M48 family metallopeptidase [Armatimonadota bacterium]
MGRYRYDEYYQLRKRVKRIKKKLRLIGCGCATVLLLATVLILVGAFAGVKQWLMPAVSGLAARVPRSIPLPEWARVPALPSGLFKLTPLEQIRLGREVAAREGIDRQANADPAIDRVAARLVKALPPQYRGPQGGWDWRFRVIRTREGIVNAMALPGGSIYVHDGLLKLAGNDPHQLALVLGHEMAHVVEEHSAEQLRAAGLLQTAADLIAAGGGGAEGEGQSADLIRAIATQLGTQIVNMQLSQSAEFQADALGLQFMRDAGYDPQKGLRILERMDRLAQSRGAGHPILGRIFSTHPPMPERIARLQRILTPADTP